MAEWLYDWMTIHTWNAGGIKWEKCTWKKEYHKNKNLNIGRLFQKTFLIFQKDHFSSIEAAAFPILRIIKLWEKKKETAHTSETKFPLFLEPPM